MLIIYLSLTYDKSHIQSVFIIVQYESLNNHEVLYLTSKHNNKISIMDKVLNLFTILHIHQ